MSDSAYFDCLVAAVERMARHPFYPDKQLAVDLFLDDIEGLVLGGRITDQQAERLRETLMNPATSLASHAA